jgi:peptidyl-prolyl cis-trans isomerase C
MIDTLSTNVAVYDVGARPRSTGKIELQAIKRICAMNLVPAFGMSNPITTARAGAAAVWLAVVLGAAGAAFGQSADTDPVIAIVNGTQVHESELQLADEIVGRNLPTQDKVERRDTLLKMLSDTILLAQVASDRKILDEADIQRRMNFARNQGLMNHLLSVVGQQAITEEAIRKAYEDVVLKPARNDPEVHLRHIVFLIKEPKDDAAVKAAEEKAQAALDRIKKGDDFAAVVADVSEDPTTRARGGDFDWRVRAEMGKEYADVAFTLKKDEVSPLIKTAVGWHIIKLEDQRVRKPMELEKLRDRIAALVANTAQFELVEKARSTAKIERLDQPGAVKQGAPSGN